MKKNNKKLKIIVNYEWNTNFPYLLLFGINLLLLTWPVIDKNILSSNYLAMVIIINIIILIRSLFDITEEVYYEEIK